MAGKRFTEEILNDPVGLHARTDYSVLLPEWTIAQALDHLRKQPPGGRVIYFYVTTADGRLVGVVPTRRLLLNPVEKLIDEIMVKSTISVPADATVLEACEFFSLYKLLALPVVDDEKKLVGVVDVELYTDELSMTPGEVRDDVFSIIGVHLTNVSQQKPWKSAKGRFPWLLCNVFGGLLAAMLSGAFQGELEWNSAVLALFVPMVLTLAESVTIQSVTLALQGMRVERTSFRKLMKQIFAESGTGLLLGAALAIIVWIFAVIWQQQLRVGSIVFIGTLGAVASAAMVGVAIPTILRLLKSDPQVAAGPVSLAVADSIALLIYFTTAAILTA